MRMVLDAVYVTIYTESHISSNHLRRGKRQKSQEMFIRLINLEVVSHQIFFVREHICARDTIR